MAMAEHIVMSEMTWTEVDEALKERRVKHKRTDA